MTSMRKHIVTSLDVGGTYIKLAAIDSRGRIILRKRQKMQKPGSKSGLYTQLADTVSSFLVERDLARRTGGIAIGFAGLTDGSRGRIYFAPNIGQLSNIEIRRELERRLGMAVVVENDANCAVLGEYWRGAARGFQSVFMFTLGTGIGGGMILNGNLWRGAFGIAGEIGHTIIDPDGPECACGNRGCLEALASGTAIVRDYIERRHMRKHFAKITTREVVERARHGDLIAFGVVKQAALALGVGIANVFNMLNPALILMGGGVSRAGDLILEPAIEKARSLITPSLRSRLLVKRSSLGDDAGVLGSAYLCLSTIGSLCSD